MYFLLFQLLMMGTKTHLKPKFLEELFALEVVCGSSELTLAFICPCT